MNTSTRNIQGVVDYYARLYAPHSPASAERSAACVVESLQAHNLIKSGERSTAVCMCFEYWRNKWVGRNRDNTFSCPF